MSMDSKVTEVFAIDLDEEIISHLVIPESFMFFKDEEVDLDLIEDEFVQRVFTWAFDHYSEHHQVATASVIAEEFDLDIIEPLTAVGDLVDRMRLRFVKNRGRGYMEKVANAYKEDPANIIEVLPAVSREILQIVGRREERVGTGDYDRAMSYYDKSVLAGPGGSFGFEGVDHHFHGLKGITFCIAAPKTYKSWITVNAVVENISQGKNVHLYSLELPADESDMRVRCLAAGVPYWRYLRGSLSQMDRESLKIASDILDSMGTYKCVKPKSGHRSIEEIVERAGDAGADMVMIDQLQYLETPTGKKLGSGDTTRYWDVLESARDLSDKMPLWIVHQFNRSVMGAEKMPEMQQAKGSAAIEETATLALGLWANRDMRKSGIIELGTLASRNYTFKAWEVALDLTRNCDFELIGEVDHDE